MSTDRSVTLNPQQLAIKAATRAAVLAAGGEKFVGAEIGRSQSRVSDYCSPNTADFIPADKITEVEALGAGSPGSPHITRALCRAQGGAFTPFVDAAADETQSVAVHLPSIAGQSADLIRILAATAALRGEIAPPLRVAISTELDQLLDVLMRLYADLNDMPETVQLSRQYLMDLGPDSS
jgi:hypothetical protein